ncbi:SRPBCC domain-containing protein [Pedobacter sp. KR3-3]|uniref:SRPBCC domain-containing protein n=1 Tax=Pedobacter albus TaxID=3113905 RepID=A0ABU7I299_9SPHI|nr:SRPBCC domain-containing protein [Pedobacter sp. KR3-3]MEE1943576.1 SRPBCC domain-containing protein [Pedobacter sp. KR3-3]
MTKREAVFSKDTENKKLTVTRSFGAPLATVWRAWTESEILDQWWAPKPFKAETKTMDCKSGGHWLYCMVGPEGERHWCKVDYHTVNPESHINSSAGFCDENGTPNLEFPIMHWDKNFKAEGDETKVYIEITFDKEEDMNTIIGMGFKEGFTAGLENLDEYLASH